MVCQSKHKVFFISAKVKIIDHSLSPGKAELQLKQICGVVSIVSLQQPSYRLHLVLKRRISEFPYSCRGQVVLSIAPPCPAFSQLSKPKEVLGILLCPCTSQDVLSSLLQASHGYSSGTSLQHKCLSHLVHALWRPDDINVCVPSFSTLSSAEGLLQLTVINRHYCLLTQ